MLPEQWTRPKKELLTIVFALDKFLSYLLGTKIIMFSDHAALRFLLKKPNAKPRLIRFHRKHLDYTKRNLKVMPSITYGMILIFGDSTMIKSYASASRTLKSSQSSNFIMQHLEVAIMDQLGQPEKCLTVGSIGPPFSETPTNSSPPTTNARKQE
ncbi:hypothetical protein CR513_21183, partial [Mucuna pruriens]